MELAQLVLLVVSAVAAATATVAGWKAIRVGRETLREATAARLADRRYRHIERLRLASDCLESLLEAAYRVHGSQRSHRDPALDPLQNRLLAALLGYDNDGSVRAVATATTPAEMLENAQDARLELAAGIATLGALDRADLPPDLPESLEPRSLFAKRRARRVANQYTNPNEQPPDFTKGNDASNDANPSRTRRARRNPETTEGGR